MLVHNQYAFLCGLLAITAGAVAVFSLRLTLRLYRRGEPNLPKVAQCILFDAYRSITVAAAWEAAVGATGLFAPQLWVVQTPAQPELQGSDQLILSAFAFPPMYHLGVMFGLLLFLWARREEAHGDHPLLRARTEGV